MLYSLFFWLHDWIKPFNVFRYITFRAALAALTSAAISYFAVPVFIKWASRLGSTQSIRQDGPSKHFSKQGTPTMGGIVIAGAILVSVLGAMAISRLVNRPLATLAKPGRLFGESP